MSFALLIARIPPFELAVDSHGEPIFPCASPSDEDCLRQVAATFGCQLCSADPAPTCFRSNDDQHVVALGAGLVDHARLYAHLTGRRFSAVEGYEDLAQHQPSVVLCLTQDVNAELLDHLYQPKAELLAPGIICADSPSALLQQLLIRAGARALAPHGFARRVDIFPGQPIGIETPTPDWWIAGELAQSAEIVEVLSRRAAVLTLYSHSDGVDARLSERLTLCPRSRWRYGPIKRAPRCAETNVCHRHNINVDLAAKSGFLIAPSSIQAGLLVYNVCCGFLDPLAAVGPEWRLIEALLANPSIGAIVTRWQLGISTPTDHLALCRRFSSGHPVGRVLADYATTHQSKNLGVRLCLFGDPDFSPPSVPEWPIEVWSAEGGTPPRTDIKSARSCSATRFLLNSLPALALNRDERVRNCAILVLSSLNADDLPDEQVLKALADVIACVGSFRGIWVSQCATDWAEPSVGVICHCCGGGATQLFLPVIDGDLRTDRLLVVCPRCGVVEDLSANTIAPCIATRPDGLIEVNLRAVEGAWAGGVLLRCHDPTETLWIPLRQDSPEQLIEFQQLPPGPLSASLVVVGVTDIAVISVVYPRYYDDVPDKPA